MNLPRRGGLLLLFLLPTLGAQDAPPAPPDLATRFAAILETAPRERRDLAARALLSLGRSGHDAFRRVLAAHPELAKSVPSPGDLPPALALVRIHDAGPEPDWAGMDEAALRKCGTAAELHLWEALDSKDAGRAARLLRELYTPPPASPPGRPSEALRTALDRKRDYDLADRSLTDFLEEEALSWILLSPRDERVTFRMRGVTLRDFFRLATPKLAAVAAGDLLVLVPPDRVASAEPGDAVWAPSDLAPRIEAAIETSMIDGLTGVGAYHALKRAARTRGDAFSARADAIRKELAQRIFFIDPPQDDGPRITLSPAGETAGTTAAAFEKAAGFPLEIGDHARLDAAPPAFRFREIPARLAARSLSFRLNLNF